MTSPVEWAAAVTASAAVGGLVYWETRDRWIAPMAALPLLATVFLGGTLETATLATGFLAARYHPLLAPVPAMATAYWLGPGPLAITGAWLLARGGPPWGGLVPLGITAILSPAHAALGAASGILGFAVSLHPANAAIARSFGRAAPWTMPAPALALFVLATLDYGVAGDQRIFRFALVGAVVGLWLAFACSGLAVRFVAVDGKATAWLAALLTASFLLGLGAFADPVAELPAKLGPLLVPLAIAAAPGLRRLGSWMGLALLALPVVSAL